MASTFNRLAFTVTRTSHRTPYRWKPTSLTQCPWNHQFHHRPSRLLARRDDDGDESSQSTTPPPGAIRQDFHFDTNDLDPNELATYNSLPAEEQAEWVAEAKRIHDWCTGPEFQASMAGAAAEVSQDMIRQMGEQKPDKPARRGREKLGLDAMGEEDASDIGPDQDFEGDDFPSLGHGELEQHREMREYARLAVWEMPLLHEQARAFVPPGEGEVLRFRYTTYLGEQHPGERKIVLEWFTKDVARVAELTEPQRVKLVKLVGVRYNPDTDAVKMSCDMFETPAQNKRYLGDLVDGLIKEAKEGEDMFEDVPLDFRHHKPKKVLEFPEAWKLNVGRRRKLMEGRKQREELEEATKMRMGLVEGREIVKKALSQQKQPRRDESQAQVEQQRGGKRRGPPRLR